MECLYNNPCPGALTGVSLQLFTALIATLANRQCTLKPTDFPPDRSNQLQNGDSYDFIVVGSGSAGSVVAGRLSETNHSVLLLEAGGFPSSTSEIPARSLALQHSSEDWSYYTETEGNGACKGYDDQKCYWPRGKVLGGTSTINGMIYVEGNDRDYNNWFVPGWSYNSLRKYFDKVNRTVKHSIPIYPRKTRQAILNGATQLGYRTTETGYISFYNSRTTIYEGKRQSAAKAYLVPARNRSNLILSLNTLVTKINFNGNIATGVTVKIGDRDLILNANKEVILSAGAINSPQILINSGIGPEDQLNDLQIAPVQVLDVGKNLQDHLFLRLFIKTNTALQEAPVDMIDETFKYFYKNEGILATVDLLNLLGFINTFRFSKYPNIQIIPTIFQKNAANLVSALGAFGYNNVSIQSIKEANQDGDTLLLSLSLLLPKSRGTIKLQSTDPLAKPLIYPNYLQNINDLNVMLGGINFISKLLATKSLRGSDFINYDIPNCRGLSFKSLAYWKCFVENFSTTTYHPVGTCKMGSGLGAVVDEKLKVHGVPNVRVIDASIMPTIISGNTNVPAMMIGEKGADMIKEDFP